THVTMTGDIGLFIITGESSVASGIRRIKASVGKAARDFIKRELDQYGARFDALQKEIDRLRLEIRETGPASNTGDQLTNKTIVVPEGRPNLAPDFSPGSGAANSPGWRADSRMVSSANHASANPVTTISEMSSGETIH